MVKKKRRIRTSHPRVILYLRTLPSGSKKTWMAKWQEPDPVNPHLKKWKSVSLDRLGLTNSEMRTAWAQKKSSALLAAEAEAVVSGKPTRPSWTIKDAVKSFLDDARCRLRPTTIKGYESALTHFMTWASERRLEMMDQLDEFRLAEFAIWLGGISKKKAVEGGRRGERATANLKRGPVTINGELKRLRVFINSSRRLGRLPLLDSDGIKDSLRGLKAPKRRPSPLRPAEIKLLLEAALRHDNERFELTREEKAEGLPGGSVFRYKPVSPFILTLLLGGFRLQEALALRWQDVFLSGEAPEIILRHDQTKTHADRAVDLAITPFLVKLLGAMKLQKGADEYVFGGANPASQNWIKSARNRLRNRFSSGDWSCQSLRQTCATILMNASGIYGGSAAFHESRRLGHSIVVAEQRYAALMRDFPKDAQTIEAAAGIENLSQAIIDRVTSGGETRVFGQDEEVKIG